MWRNIEKSSRATKMAQQVKELATNPDNLSSIPGNIMVEEVNGPSCYLISEYIPGMHTCSCGEGGRAGGRRELGKKITIQGKPEGST